MSEALHLPRRVRSVSILSFAPSLQKTDSARNSPKTGLAQVDTQPDQPEEGVTTPDQIEAAYDEGVVAGTTATRMLLEQEYEGKLVAERRRIDALFAAIDERFQRIHRHLEQSVIRFALGVAEHIVKREVKLDSEVVIRQIRESLRRVVGVDRVKLRLHPKDEMLVREQRASMLKGVDSIREILIEADEKVEAGGCILESDLGNIDARLATQMKTIEEILLNKEARDGNS